MNSNLFCRFIGLGAVMLIFAGVNSIVAQAQQPLNWSPQARISMYEDFTEEPPFLVADQNHTVHAFNVQPLDLGDDQSSRAIVYRQWTLEQGWTKPTDIILNPGGGNIALMDVYFDQVGVVHLAVKMNDTEIFHSQAPLLLAGQASAWSAPQFVGGQALPTGPGLPYNAAITGDENGNLMILYSGERDGNGLYAVYSVNNGDNWAEPDSVFLTYDTSIVPAGPKLYSDQSGHIHAVWNTFDNDGVGVSGYYARLDTALREWSSPFEIDQGGLDLGIKFVNLFEHNDELILTYYNGKTNGNWWRRSSNSGQTWSGPLPISPRHVGTNGPVSFVVDSSQVLHLLFGQRIDDNNHGIWHSIWTGAGWTDPEPVVWGPQVKDKIGGRGFDPRSAKAAIVNGNLLLVTWGTDGAAGENGAWYSYTILDTPELPAVPLPVPSPAITATPLPTATPIVTIATSSPTQRREVDSSVANTDIVAQRSPMLSVLMGLIPVVLLLITVIVARQYTQSH